MKSIEQAGPIGAGTVTAACVFLDGEPTFQLVVYAALLRLLPWFRGGRSVSVQLSGSELTVMRDGPHQLLCKVSNQLDKLPPVQLRVPRLDYLRPIEATAEPVAYEVRGIGLTITLPEWARPPMAPASLYSGVVAGGRR